MNHEAVLAAFFAWLVSQTGGLFLTTSRRLQHWALVADQPALYLRHIGTTVAYRGDLQMSTLECEVWIYSNAGADQDVAPDIALNQLVLAVWKCFAPDLDDARFTLNGLVYWCRIEGRIDAAPGDQGPQAIARVPVRITLP